MTIEEIILKNNWKSSSWEDSTDVNALINSGVTTSLGAEAQAMLDILDTDNVQDTMEVGLVSSDFVEQNFGDASDTVAGSIEAIYGSQKVKMFYGNQWWAVRGINKDLMKTTKPVSFVLNKIGSYWATMWNRIITATLAGMSNITSITIGDGTANLDRIMVVDAMAKKGDMGFGALDKMYMNSKTFADQLKKQITAGDILFTRAKAEMTIGADGRAIVNNTNADRWVYDGVTPIVLDDTFADGVITLLSDGAFAFGQANIEDPLMLSDNAKSGNGSGKKEYGTKSLYIMHPLGFSFKGVYGTDYASRSGLSLAELQGGELYEPSADAKLLPITNLKVKIGA